MPLISELPDIDDAIARLDAAEAAETNPQPEQSYQEAEPVIPDQPGDSETIKAEKNPVQEEKTDTQVEAVKKPDTEPVQKTDNATSKTDPKSAFAKDKVRRDESWKALNEQKTALQKEQEAFKAQAESLKKQQEQFEIQRVKARQRYTPEQYEQAGQQKLSEASQIELQADGMEARAAKLEESGDYNGADKLRQQAKLVRDDAAGLRYNARQYKDMADNARRNPDPSEQQIMARRQQESQHYTLEAAKRWPDIAKAGSDFNKAVAEHLKTAAQQGIDPNEYPIMIYHAARLTAAETAATRVPGLEKELVELKAKVKEYETLTNPGGGKESVKTIPKQRPQTDDEEFESLRAMAAGVS